MLLWFQDKNPLCVPEGFPYESNHSCAMYVPVGHYKCECVSISSQAICRCLWFLGRF
jgi:hypothetical protein